MDLIEFFMENIFALDYLVAVLILIVVSLFYFTEKLNKDLWILFWIGFVLGLIWEIPIGLSRELGAPLAVFVKPRPVLPFPLHSIMHSLWDGGIFLIGIYLVYYLKNSPHFKKFDKIELIIFIIWGQVQSVIFEIASLIIGLWNYIPNWWNPSLFDLDGHHFTLLPQLIWIVASIIFYFITLKFPTLDNKTYNSV